MVEDKESEFGLLLPFDSFEVGLHFINLNSSFCDKVFPSIRSSISYYIEVTNITIVNIEVQGFHVLSEEAIFSEEVLAFLNRFMFMHHKHRLSMLGENITFEKLESLVQGN